MVMRWLNRQVYCEFDTLVIRQVTGTDPAAMRFCYQAHNVQAKTKVLASALIVPQGYKRIE